MEEKKDKKTQKQLIVLIALTIILLPFVLRTFIETKNKKEEPKKSVWNTNSEQKDIIKDNNNDSPSEEEKNNKNNKDNLESKIKNSYCDTYLTPENSVYKDYIYYSTVVDNCALIADDNNELISEYTLKAYNKALKEKSKWSEKFSNKENNSQVSLAYGKFTIKNKNGNILGFAVTITVNKSNETKIYALTEDNEWELVKE